MVVMEYVNGFSWNGAMERSITPLQDAVWMLHDAGVVRGDLSAKNTDVVSDRMRNMYFKWGGMRNKYFKWGGVAERKLCIPFQRKSR